MLLPAKILPNVSTKYSFVNRIWRSNFELGSSTWEFLWLWCFLAVIIYNTRLSTAYLCSYRWIVLCRNSLAKNTKQHQTVEKLLVQFVKIPFALSHACILQPHPIHMGASFLWRMRLLFSYHRAICLDWHPQHSCSNVHYFNFLYQPPFDII